MIYRGSIRSESYPACYNRVAARRGDSSLGGSGLEQPALTSPSCQSVSVRLARETRAVDWRDREKYGDAWFGV